MRGAKFLLAATRAERRSRGALQRLARLRGQEQLLDEEEEEAGGEREAFVDSSGGILELA